MLTANPVGGPHVVTEERTSFELDTRLERADLFKVYREVSGTYIQPRPGTKDRGARIDRLLIPNAKLLSLGWRYGAIGIECKKPDKKLGPAIAQCMDYTRAVFQLPSVKVDIMPRWVMLWPMSGEQIVGDIGSLMDQNRVGGITFSPYYVLQFKTASCNMLAVSHNGDVTVGKVLCGTKVGSR